MQTQTGQVYNAMLQVESLCMRWSGKAHALLNALESNGDIHNTTHLFPEPLDIVPTFANDPTSILQQTKITRNDQSLPVLTN